MSENQGGKDANHHHGPVGYDPGGRRQPGGGPIHEPGGVTRTGDRGFPGPSRLYRHRWLVPAAGRGPGDHQKSRRHQRGFRPDHGDQRQHGRVRLCGAGKWRCRELDLQLRTPGPENEIDQVRRLHGDSAGSQPHRRAQHHHPVRRPGDLPALPCHPGHRDGEQPARQVESPHPGADQHQRRGTGQGARRHQHLLHLCHVLEKRLFFLPCARRRQCPAPGRGQGHRLPDVSQRHLPAKIRR